MLTNNTTLQTRSYRIECQLGHGGQGTVYKAIHTILGNSVALKETLCSDDEGIKDFAREARLLANLNHPGLPRVTDFFKENNNHYLVMEYIAGKDLSQLLMARGSAFPVEQVLAWADQLLNVLEYLHGLETPIIHRDIKPANLKLNQDGKILLLDFGLAKQQAPGATRSVCGYSPHYSPLEQLNGDITDQRSDLFSLGSTLYCLLTGKNPEDVRVRNRIIEQGVADNLRSVCQINLQVPESISFVIWKAMAINREHRYQTATEFRKALQIAGQSRSDAQKVVIPIPPAPPLSPPPVIVTPNPENPLLGGLKKLFAGFGKTPEPPVVSPPPRKPVVPPPVSQLPRSFQNSIGMQFVLIPAGSFLMGSPDTEAGRSRNEGPQHKVTFSKPFYLGKFQVTQAEWQAVMGTNPSYFKGENLPVEHVSWYCCQEFLEKLNANKGDYLYRLPSEAEWEYACRAGTTTPFSFGHIITTDQANYDGNCPYGNGSKGEYRQKTTPVGSFPANAWGLHDLHGNVWEWCQDVFCYEPNYDKTPIDGNAWEGVGCYQGFHVLRGGSRKCRASDCRAARRFGGTIMLPEIGFRVVAVRALNI